MYQPKLPYPAGIDFTPVQTLSEDPRDRSSYFAAFKTLLNREREKIKLWHRSGAGGREVVQAHTGLMDDVIRHITGSLARLEPYADANALGECAVVAVGGYGRGELNPCSDIDLLFLRPSRIRKSTDAYIQEIISLLWGIGLEIGQSCRSVKECLEMARQDLTIKTSMIETRFLTGHRETYETFCQSINKNVLKKNIKAFLDSKLKEKYARYREGDGVVGTPEPDIKNGPGGLRDYHTALWAVAVRFGCLSFRDISGDDVISTQELDTLDGSVDFALRVRNELHYLTGKKSDVLSLPLQSNLAAHLGYHEENGRLPAEKFMQDYFRHARNIHRFSETIFERCLQPKRSLRTVTSWLQKKPLAHGFHALKSELVTENAVEDLFQKNSGLLLTVFDLCREHQLEPDPRLKRQIRLHRHLIDCRSRMEGGIRDFLLRTLDDQRSEKIFRLMHQTGLLGRLLPEFGQSYCVVSYDFYHHYTADEHSLRMLRFLEELGAMENTDLEELAQVYTGVKRKIPLKLAALMQSICKTSGPNGDGTSREQLALVTQNLGLGRSEEDVLHFLVAHPYEMVETALHQDIHQPLTIQEFGRKMETPERLDLLYLFSYAELRAVAPGTWTPWKKLLLSELYHRTRDYLQNPESLQTKPQAARDEIYQVLHGEFPTGEIEHHLSLMPEDYLISTRSEEVARHLRVIRSLEKEPLFVLDQEYNEVGGVHTLILCCPAELDGFKKLVGTLAAKDMNIIGAQIYLRKDSIALFNVQVEAAESLEACNADIWEKVNRLLREVLENKKQLSKVLVDRTRYMVEKNARSAIVPRIHIDNPAQSAFTVIRIEARDHLGLLYKIATTLADFNIQIHRAKISTLGGRAVDVFFVSLRNQKIVHSKVIRRIKERLVQVLLTERLEDIR